ncbi:MAG: hypothetical protein J1F35_06920 [Erysipelotrichales bacterium]|nr:hypothetical protein [Erysipelotrichales bacterium]
MDQKMMKTLGIVIAGFVVFILIIFLIASCTNTKYTYEKLEEKMLSVAKNYYQNNEKELPSQDKDTRSYTLKKMISDGSIDELTELFDNENIKCDGNVTVTNNNGYYVYTPYLTCGKDYQTTYLKDKIIENSLVEAGAGLYETSSEYIFKGDVKNNYVSFAGKTFRIIRINEDNTIRLIDNIGISEVIWDSKYNTTVQDSNGVNDYVVDNNLYANIKNVSDNYYKNNNVWTDENRTYIATQSLCIGKRSTSDTTKDGSTECSLKLDNQLFGSLAVYEYLQASLDKNCNNTTGSACTNYNWYTSISNSFWSVTANVSQTDRAFSIYKKPITTLCSSYNHLNVVFNLTSNVVYVDGDGTANNPYVFK